MQVAHNQVRNIGSVAGNLMLTHAHGEFASDISTILMAAEAKLRVGFAWENGDEHVISLEQFFNLSLDGAVIVEIFIPVMKASARFFTYKVALRRVNAHALLNAGFKLAVNSTKGKGDAHAQTFRFRVYSFLGVFRLHALTYVTDVIFLL
jgi:xanthine dehydrogenase/oxidase